MLKEILSAVKEKLETLDGISKAEVYKGEYEDGSNWKPVYPSVFYSFNGYKPQLRSKGGIVIGDITQVRIYGADKSLSEAKGLEFIESVIDLLDGARLTVIIDKDTSYIFNVEIADNGMEPYKYSKGLQSFTLDVNIFQ